MARRLAKERRSAAAVAAEPPRDDQMQAPLPPLPLADQFQVSFHQRALISAAVGAPDGAVADDRMLGLLAAEIVARRGAAAVTEGPADPLATGLAIRRRDLPDWWHGRGNLFLCGPHVSGIDFAIQMWHPDPPEGVVVVAGTSALLPRLQFGGRNSLVVLGDDVRLVASALSIGEDCTALIGDQTTSAGMLLGDVRNAGTVVVGQDVMLGGGCSLQTDDTHAIRKVNTMERVNVRGGRIVIDRHVWVREQSRVMGDCYIGHDSVIETGSFVKNKRLPAHVWAAGRPARIIRSGITWTREDGS